MTRYLADILDRDYPNVDASVRWLIDEFYGRANRLRYNSTLFLYTIYLVLAVGVLFVIFAGQLTRFDVAAQAGAKRDAIIERSEQIAQQGRDAFNRAVRDLSPWQIDGTPNSQFRDDEFPFVLDVWVRKDRTDGWAVGQGGRISRYTVNGGWQSDETASKTTKNSLNGLWISPDGMQGWAVGSGGEILRYTTEDGWVREIEGSNVTNSRLEDVWLNNAGRSGWAVGQDGHILRYTIDGGWQRDETASRATNRSLNGLWVSPDGMQGWAVGLGGEILRYTQADGWRRDEEAAELVNNSLYGIDFGPQGLWGLAVGSGGVTLRYEDDLGWLRDEIPPGVGFAVSLYDVWINSSAKEGWVVGEEGSILRYTFENGWGNRDEDRFPYLDLTAIWLDPTGTYGWAMGRAGTTFKKVPISFPVDGLSPITLLQNAQKSEASKRYEAVGLIDQLKRLAARYEDLQSIRSVIPDQGSRGEKNNDPPEVESFFGKTTIIRIGVLLLLAFLLQLLVSLYRYNNRLAAYYDARADALVFTATKGGDLSAVIEMISPDHVDFGKIPKPGAKQFAEIAKALSHTAGHLRRV